MLASEIIILCLLALVQCEFTKIKVPATIERNKEHVSYKITAEYQDKYLWITEKHIPTLVKLRKDNNTEIKVLKIINCTLEHIEKGALNEYTEIDVLEIYENNLKEIKSEVIKGKLWRAFLRRNKIKHIDDGAFSNLTNLKEVFLGHNELEEISSRWFSNCTKLGVLNLLGNKIKYIASKSFINMSTIYSLNLDFNQISSIEPGAFEELSDLYYLGLSFNQITVLPPNIFPKFLEIELFDISFNHLNFISTKTLERLHLKYIHITPNPWECNCLQNIENWITQRKLSTFVYVHCSGVKYPLCISKSLDSKVCDETFDMQLSTEYYKGYWNMCNRSYFDYSDKDIDYELTVKYL